MCNLAVRPKRHKCGSWACNVCGDRIGRHVAPRLLERLKWRSRTHSVVALTLTLDRSLFESPTAALDFVKRNHAVSRTVHAWGMAKGFDLAASFFVKMELQKGGWPHWHVLVEVPRERVDAETGEVLPVTWRLPVTGDPGDTITQFWKWGRSQTDFQVNEDGVRYLCKYACKEAGGDVALVASGFPDHGIKWISCARKFWAIAGMSEPTEAEGWEAAKEFEDESVGGDVPAGLLSDRVEYCRRTSIVEVALPSGAYESFELPISRRKLAELLTEPFGCDGEVVETFEESGIARLVVVDSGRLAELGHQIGGYAFVEFVEECERRVILEGGGGAGLSERSWGRVTCVAVGGGEKASGGPGGGNEPPGRSREKGWLA